MKPTPNKLSNILETLQQQEPPQDDTPSAAIGPQEFTIDQLAYATGVTVRNIRAYQDRGLLPPPQRRGRVGIYTDVHQARMRIINQLIERGYSLATIGDLIAAWESGRKLSDVLGLEVAVTTAWSKETPSYISPEQLFADFGASLTQESAQKAIKLGYLQPEGTRIRVLKPRIYNASKELVAAGIPLDDLMEHVSLVRMDIEKLAERFVSMALHHLIDKKYGIDGLPDGEGVATLAKFIKRTPVLAEMVVDSEIERLLDMTLNNALVARLEKLTAASTKKRKRSLATPPPTDETNPS